MQGIGQLLWKLREKEGIRQKQLCLGISSVSKYARMEADQQEIDFFLKYLLFEKNPASEGAERRTQMQGIIMRFSIDPKGCYRAPAFSGGDW